MTRLTALSAIAALVLVCGCVQDPKIEDEVPPSVGITQPKSDSGATIGATETCQELTSAERSARRRLGCADAGAELACPNYVYLAGAVPCGEYERSTVESCVSTIGAYTACQDFDTKACVVTVVRDSCKVSVPSDAGRHDSSVAELPEASTDAGKPTPDAAPAGADAGKSTDSGHD